MSGHSFGGITAIVATEADSRIKALFTLDPWLWVRASEIYDGTFAIKQHQFHIESEGFAPLVEDAFEYDNDKAL